VSVSSPYIGLELILLSSFPFFPSYVLFPIPSYIDTFVDLCYNPIGLWTPM
jgi:hypothetical protein